MKEVSIVIPNWNGMKYLPNCLAALKNQDYQNFEIIVVDNGSEDESCAFLDESYPEIQVIALERNHGFCYAVNRGIQASQAKYVILLNNDTEAEKGFVREMVAGIKRYPLCFSGAARMLQLYDKTKIDSAGDYYNALGWAYSAGKDKLATRYLVERKVFAACAGAAIYRREVFEIIGYFDEKHFAYLEDIDIGYRAKVYGYTNRYFPKAVVYHAGSGVTGSRHNEFKVRYSSRNNVYLIYKNMPLWQILLNSPVLLLGFLTKLLFFATKGLGVTYVRGIGNGVLLSFRGKKVKAPKGQEKNYLKIQQELWLNIFRYR